MFGFHRIAAVRPAVKVANPRENAVEMVRLARAADADSAALALFPELATTGCSCGDLFHSSTLLDASDSAFLAILEATKDLGAVVVAGLPVRRHGKLFSCAAVMHRGALLGVVPKSYIANRREFYERRWFASGKGSSGSVNICGVTAPFGDDLIFEKGDNFSFGVEICEDLWTPNPPSSGHALAGATLLLNLSASDELVAKAAYRKKLVSGQSARCVAGYVYASAGSGESTGDVVYGGHLVIAENGRILCESKRFENSAAVITADIDCEMLRNIRMSETSFDQHSQESHRRITLGNLNAIRKVRRCFTPRPFVPDTLEMRTERCQEIVSIQTTGLARRLDAASAQRAVVGVSGGLDSTLALLVVVEALKQSDKPSETALAVTMPGFGTSKRTLGNALKLCRVLGVETREIDIKTSCMAHFNDIGHDPDSRDVTYENVQARERTQILMDLANKENGLVIGTGDLSEAALGWSTYNGDHMSMYAVNCGVPKTLVRHLVEWFAATRGGELAAVLHSVLDTPVSPELLPTGEDGEVAQKTEEIIGLYEVHDFFLYHMIKHGASPSKLLFLAETAFAGKLPKNELEKHLETFVKRFFANQFKRDCVPNGPKVGTIALSPRGDWRMPSDASADAWLDWKHDEN